MLERKKLVAGIFAALLALNLYGTKVEAATDAETEGARMWGGFRDKISCTVEGSVANTTTTTKETVIVKEVPVYRYPFLFIWDDWYHWGRWHHHHHVWHRPPRPPRPHISRPPVHRPPRPHVGKPIPRPPRPAISRPASRPGGNRPVMRPASKPRPQMRSAPSRSRNEEMIFQNGGPRGGGARHHGGGRPSGARGPRRR